MCANKFEKSEKYSGAREAFDGLNVEEKAVFIVESAVNMLVQGVKKAGDAFSDAFEHINVDQEQGEEETDHEPVKKKTKSTKSKASATKKKAAKKTDDTE